VTPPLAPYTDREIEEAERLAIDLGLVPASGFFRVPEEQGSPCTAEDVWEGVCGG